MNCCDTPVKHTQEECQIALAGIKKLIERIDRIEDEYLRHHVCESAIDICNKLLREPPK